MIGHRLRECFFLELNNKDDRDQNELFSKSNKVLLSGGGSGITLMLKTDALNTFKSLHNSPKLIKGGFLAHFTFATLKYYL